MRLGVDIGGTKIEAALVSEKGKIIKKVRMPTQASKGRKAVINSIVSAIRKLDREDVKFIGLSIAGVVDRKGILDESPHIKCLMGLNVAKEISKIIEKKVLQENDAKCFALAEFWHGAGKGSKNMIGLIIGTGIGGGIIINGSLYKGNIFGAGEIGHTIIDGRQKFESICSGPAIIEQYRKAGGKLKTKMVSDLMKSKEPAAKKTLDEAFRFIGIGLANTINTFDPEIIVLGGGLSNLPFYEKIRKEAGRYAIPAMFKNTCIVKNKLGDSSGVIGAAFLRQ